MTKIAKIGLSAAIGALALSTPGARAETILEQGMEHRFQLDFHVNDAALQKLLPKGWEPAVAAMGPAKDANIRMIFIDRMSIMGADNKPIGKGSNRLVYLAVPVKEAGTQAIAGQMIIAGLSQEASDMGPFGVYKRASSASMTRTISAQGPATVQEDWDFAAPSGEHVQVHVKYERGPANKGGGEVKFFSPADPSKYQIFRTEQGLDILRNVPTNPPDRVKEFSYKASGGAFSALFDGSEEVLSWDSFPWYNRTVTTP